jgi:hypothetical protein
VLAANQRHLAPDSIDIIWACVHESLRINAHRLGTVGTSPPRDGQLAPVRRARGSAASTPVGERDDPPGLRRQVENPSHPSVARQDLHEPLALSGALGQSFRIHFTPYSSGRCEQRVPLGSVRVR